MCIKLFKKFSFALNKNDYAYLMKIYNETIKLYLYIALNVLNYCII